MTDIEWIICLFFALFIWLLLMIMCLVEIGRRLQRILDVLSVLLPEQVVHKRPPQQVKDNPND